MDIHNVTSEYGQVLERQKEVLKKAKKRQGQRPRDWKPRDETYMRYMMSIIPLRQQSQGLLLHSSFIPPAYQPCTTSLLELNPINIRDLQLETHHRGKYVLLRAITPPKRMTGILVLVEDECRDVVLLQIYQQDEEDTRAATDIVNVGTVLLVKEPFLKQMASGEYGLRVDHLSDFISIDEHDSRIPEKWRPRVLDVERSAESLKLKGNIAMREGNQWQAILE